MVLGVKFDFDAFEPFLLIYIFPVTKTKFPYVKSEFTHNMNVKEKWINMKYMGTMDEL